MKYYVLWWFILLHVGCCEDIQYSDYHPERIPFQAENPSVEYTAVMKNLCDNWRSPISYLKKRGYMPKNGHYEPQKKAYYKSLEKGENYFFFPNNKEQRSRSSILALENDNSSEKSNVVPLDKLPSVSEVPPVEKPTNETTGIINKVKDKFLSIFTHKDKNKSEQIEEEVLGDDDSEFLENYNDYDEISEKRIFSRSISEKPTKSSNSTYGGGDFSNLTDPEINFIKSFIKWFKENKNDFKFLSTPNLNKTALAKSNQTISKDTNKPYPQNSTVNSGTKPNSVFSECEPATTIKINTDQKQISILKNNGNASETSGKDVSKDLTLDLDINQKNGTGEEIQSTTQSTFVEILLKNSTTPCSVDRNKYLTKAKFLAHLHHMVDEIGKPPHKPLDLTKIQDIIDNSKTMPTVTMGGDKTTQCVPLQLNDMSFDLEWNKLNALPQNGPEKMNNLDFSYASQDQGQSLASKFLQELSSYPEKSNEYLQSPYDINFLDSQQSLPSNLDLPFKSSTKREAGLPYFGADFSPFPESDYVYDMFDDEVEASPKRRIKGRIRNRGKKKKPKKTKYNPKATTSGISTDLNDDITEGTDFTSFDELKDIQFRVNDNDEEAISTFISNLNSPPEIFSFDVDKYLRSAKQEMQPKAPQYEFQSPEQPRTFYEFLESPAVENERLTLIDASSQNKDQEMLEKRSKGEPEKRDLLRQYIKGVSSALDHNFEDSYYPSCNTHSEDKLQRSPSLDSDVPLTANSLEDGLYSNLDEINSNKEKEDNDDDTLNNYFLLNDGSAQVMDAPMLETGILPNDYSSKSLEIDLDLDKKFRDLNIGRYNSDDTVKNLEVASKDSSAAQASALEMESNDSY